MGLYLIGGVCISESYLLFSGCHARGDCCHCEGEGGDADAEADVSVARQPVGDVADEGAGGDDGDVGQLC